MIRPDTRRRRVYTKAEWESLPRDYRFVVQIDFSDVVEREAKQRLLAALRALRPNEVKVWGGINDENPVDLGQHLAWGVEE